jgi:hypothetical protein
VSLSSSDNLGADFIDANGAETKSARISRREFGLDAAVAAAAATLSLSPPSSRTARRDGAGASGRELGIGSAHEGLYSTYKADTPKNKPVALTFIPYDASANREAAPMQVWTPLLTA